MTVLLLAVVMGAPPDFTEEIQGAVDDVKSVFVVPPALVKAIIQQESAFNPKALSPCGAVGLMQVMPFNAASLGLKSEKELWVPRLNILAGTRLLAALLQHYQGDVIAALVAYNSGPKRRWAPVPANGETPAYVTRILGFWRDVERSTSNGSGSGTGQSRL
jgi:hypothetical protein